MRYAAFSMFWVFCALQTGSFAQPVEGLVNIRFRTDVRVFAVMAAVNLAGFDAQDTDNAVRELVRKRLRSIDSPVVQEIRRFYQSQTAGLETHDLQAGFISFALCLTGPPHFGLSIPARDVPADAQRLLGLEPLLEKLWSEGTLQRLWEEVHPAYVQEIEKYRPLIREWIVSTLKYLHTEARVALDRQVTLMPDFLNERGVVNARNIGHDYMVVVTPSGEVPGRVTSIGHEYLHFMLDPLIQKYVAYLPDPDPFLKIARQQSKAQPLYGNDFMVMLTESLIQMVELRLYSHPDQEQRVAAAYDQGLILAPYCWEALQRFEKSTEGVQDFFPGLIRGIALAQAVKRPAITPLAQQSVEQVQRDAPPLNSRVGLLLKNANELLLAKQFDAAKEKLVEVLHIEPQNAGALFGMAQIALQNHDFDNALKLYGDAAANAGEQSWIAAWAMVHRGDIFAFQDKPEAALAEWASVLKIQGDLRGAADAAAKKIAENTVHPKDGEKDR